MQKLKPSLPGASGHTSEHWDRHEGELGHATIGFFSMRLIGENISTIIKNTSEEVTGNNFTLKFLCLKFFDLI